MDWSLGTFQSSNGFYGDNLKIGYKVHWIIN